MTWQFWIDVGGTFTDCLARRPDGALLPRKVLSSAATKGQATLAANGQAIFDPIRQEPAGFWRDYRLRLIDRGSGTSDEFRVVNSAPGRIAVDPCIKERHGGRSLHAYELVSPEEAPLLAIRLFLGLALDQPFPACVVRLGTTRGTNALLTRRGARTAFVTTRGFRDLLDIGYQSRPKLFELAIQKPLPLYSAVAEIDERIAADGSILSAPHTDQVRAELSRLKSAGIESLAVCLLNAYANPAHEELVEKTARELGFDEISVSTRVSPLRKIVPRGDTTVVDAYLNPVLRQYVQRLAAALPSSGLRLMTSAGGLAVPASFTGKDSILSGPAGGVVGFSRAAQAAGFEQAIGFDMGGTSTDVAHYGGRFEREYETQKAGVRMVAPMLAIETVAAGGGSICRWDGVKPVVGPDSAGAEPGPACYGRGGPLTITDCNLLLGRMAPQHFPFPLDHEAALRRIEEIADVVRSAAVGSATAGVRYSALDLAEGFVRIADANMAQAIHSVSIAKGHDIRRQYALVAFGSAGPQHACAVASELGIDNVLIHPHAGVLSALGIGLADVVKHGVRAIYRTLDEESLVHVGRALAELSHAASDEVRADTETKVPIEVTPSLELRYAGTDVAIEIAQPPDRDYTRAFAERHEQLYGYVHAGRSLEIVAARVEAVGRTAAALPASRAIAPNYPEPDSTCEIRHDGAVHATGLFRREGLTAGAVVVGPALIVEPQTTTVVDRGWRAQTLTGGELLLTRTSTPPVAAKQSTALALSEPDPVLLEVFSNHFTAIATQMGITLRNTAISVNVKERLDFSCAIFTAEGDLVVNAPHIPVHLGAMSDTVKRIIADNPALRSGDVFLTNDPYRGGSHLPDVTVVTPVFAIEACSQRPIFFTANRAHHAEIGGITPGSVPPFSRTLAEEGVLIRNFWLLDAGRPRDAELRELLSSPPFPSRSVDTNLADIAAQVAANQQGANDLLRMVAPFSLPVALAYMLHLQSAAERKMRAALARLQSGRREFVDHLDNGVPIRVAVTIDGDSATIDFTGTGGVLPGNLNANRAIVKAAVMYVLRLLIGEDIPLNQGVLAPISLVLPECLLNPPEWERAADCAAIVGGNMETSQRVVDVLLGAFGLAAASQGTMNNVLFGDSSFGYYETICGGSGATATADGADAVHTHMTNTRLTDPEVLEARYPVRLLEFGVRPGSGGAGAHRGGDGVSRRIEFLKPLTLSILSQRRGPFPPYGMAGGQPGALGKNTLTRAGGSSEELAALAQVEVAPGDILTIETPGGGGWGVLGD